MTDDATLTDFESSADENDAERPPSDRIPDDSSATGSDDGTALSTYAWGTYTCARCGTSTDRAWRDDESFVCPDCKSW